MNYLMHFYQRHVRFLRILYQFSLVILRHLSERLIFKL